MRLLDSRLAAAVLLVLAAPALAATKPAPAKSAPKSVKTAAAEPSFTPESLMADAHAAAGRGDTELALRLAQSAIVADPTRPAAYDTLADVYAGLAQPDFARNYYNEALSIDPGDAAATKAIAALDGSSDTRAARVDNHGAKTGTP